MRNLPVSLTSFEGLPVLAPTSGETYRYYPYYLAKNRELLNTMLSHHSKVLFLRFDLHFPQTERWLAPTSSLSGFLDMYRRLLVERHFDPQYMIRMEQQTSINPHFHVVLLLNGNKAQFPYFHKQEAGRLWQRVLNVEANGLTDFCNRDSWGYPLPEGIMIVRPSSCETWETNEYREAFRIMSYLAKHVPEDRIPSYQRKVFCSLNNRV
jgi:hypothetical protein